MSDLFAAAKALSDADIDLGAWDLTHGYVVNSHRDALSHRLSNAWAALRAILDEAPAPALDARLRAEHEAAWAEADTCTDTGQHPVNHGPDPEDCDGCRFLARWAAPAPAPDAERKALDKIADKTQAAAYHRNYRQACIEINEIALDALAAARAGQEGQP